MIVHVKTRVTKNYCFREARLFKSAHGRGQWKKILSLSLATFNTSLYGGFYALPPHFLVRMDVCTRLCAYPATAGLSAPLVIKLMVIMKLKGIFEKKKA